MDHLDKELDRLVSDPSFRRYALNQDDSAREYWENWLDSNPGKKPILQRAKALVQLGSASRRELSPEEIHIQWQALEKQLFNDNLNNNSTKSARFFRLWPFMAIAAACIVFLAFLFWPEAMRSITTEKQILHTNYGEKKEVTLPDGSKIVMNANSELVYYSPWDSTKPREVWLSGECFFDVAHKPKIGGQEFRVHLNDLTVDVLGTSFNVNSRHNQTQVVLQRGKVQLTRNHDSDTLVMNPGELVKYDDNELFIKRKVDANSYTSWTENRLIFQENTLRSIGEMIVDQYGLNVEIIGDESFARRTFSGEAIVENLDDFIFLLESFDITTKREEDRLLIYKSDGG